VPGPTARSHPHPQAAIDVPGVAPDPADDLALAEAVGIALHVLLDRLTPKERVAFVLHDSFGFDFDTIAQVLDTTSVTARKLASRARSKTANRPPRTTWRDGRSSIPSWPPLEVVTSLDCWSCSLLRHSSWATQLRCCHVLQRGCSGRSAGLHRRPPGGRVVPSGNSPGAIRLRYQRRSRGAHRLSRRP
jgi:hypothetical protein